MEKHHARPSIEGRSLVPRKRWASASKTNFNRLSLAGLCENDYLCHQNHHSLRNPWALSVQYFTLSSTPIGARWPFPTRPVSTSIAISGRSSRFMWCAIGERKFVFDALSLVFYGTKLRGSSTHLHGVSYWNRVSDPLCVFDAYRPPGPFRVKMLIFISASCCIKHTVLQVTLANSNYFKSFGVIPAQYLVRDFRYNGDIPYKGVHPSPIPLSTPPLEHAFEMF